MFRGLLTLFLLGILAGFANGQPPQDTPLQFVQRNVVRRELSVTDQQLEMVQRLQPVCDAQCEAQMMEMFAAAGADLQAQFLTLEPAVQQQATQNIESPIREQVETEALTENVLNDEQATRFMQLRTQFRGIGSLLDDRVGSLLGLDNQQISQLREIQNFGSELINECLSNSELTPFLQQQGVNNINTVLIDQSINILNNNQIQIFVGLCGEACNFDPPAENETGGHASETPAGVEGAPTDLEAVAAGGQRPASQPSPDLQSPTSINAPSVPANQTLDSSNRSLNSNRDPMLYRSRLLGSRNNSRNPSIGADSKQSRPSNRRGNAPQSSSSQGSESRN